MLQIILLIDVKCGTAYAPDFTPVAELIRLFLKNCFNAYFFKIINNLL